MSRPLLITDCDEVLLHMMSHFGAWLGEAHDLDFSLESQEFARAVTRRPGGEVVAVEEIWPLLNGFFDTEMHRQTLVPHAREALVRLGRQADIVVLTNLQDEYQPGRVAQLDALDIRHRVVTNQGGKGAPVKKLVEEFQPSVTVFVDDLGIHHESVAKHAPEVWRLHMIAEPILAVRAPKAPAAHARIDDWAEAVEWIEERFAA